MASHDTGTVAPAGAEVVQATGDIARRLSWPAPSEQQPAIPEHLLERFLTAVEQIPAEGGGGVEGILAQLLSAETVDDLNAPWETTNGRSLAGRTLVIRDIIRRPSSFAEGPQLFLVVQSADRKTGEELTWTTSALAVILQLAVAYVMGMFPLQAEVVVAERPTERGFYPYHLRVLAAGNSQRSDG